MASVVAYGATSAADDDDDVRFGHDGYTTELTEEYVTTAQYMAKDLNDPYAYENKPMHYIPGYTGHLPLNRERFGVNYREASAATLAMQRAKGVHHPVVPLDAPAPNHFGSDKIKKLNRSQKFIPADQVAQEEATVIQQGNGSSYAQGPYGVYSIQETAGKMEYVTTNSRVAPDNKPEDASSLASRIAHRRVARTKRNLNGGLFRPDPYDDSVVDDIAALDPRLKILQTRSEYRSEESDLMQTSSEELFDMRDDGNVYSGANAMGGF